MLIHLLHSCTCFEHYYAHLQEDNCIIQHLVSSLSLGDCSVHSLREDSRNLRTEQSHEICLSKPGTRDELEKQILYNNRKVAGSIRDGVIGMFH